MKVSFVAEDLEGTLRIHAKGLISAKASAELSLQLLRFLKKTLRTYPSPTIDEKMALGMLCGFLDEADEYIRLVAHILPCYQQDLLDWDVEQSTEEKHEEL